MKIYPEDKDVLNVWKCLNCGDEDHITPDWYECNGTPMCCECDKDMSYLYTIVVVDELSEKIVKANQERL